MIKDTPTLLDPLANIEDMLSSLCNAQSGRQQQGQNNLNGNNVQNGITSPEEVNTTPDRSTSSKDSPKKAQPRRKTPVKASKRRPLTNPIRKPQKGRGKQRSKQRTSSKAADTRDFDDEDSQQDQDLFGGGSSDDPENRNFLNQMKFLAEEQLDAQKRKNDAMNVQAVNSMQGHTDQCVQKMQQIVGKVSSDITKRAAEIEGALPSSINEQTASAMNTVKSATVAISDFKEQAKTFEDQLDKLVQELEGQRKENDEKFDAEEKEKHMNVKAFCASGQRLVSVLQEIDKVIDVDQFRGK